MNIRLFASDLDGTLLDSSSVISERSAAAIRHVQEEGKIFLAATGRGWESVWPILKAAGISFGAVLLNGAEYRTGDGEVIFREYIEEETAGKILRLLTGYGIEFETHTGCGGRILKFFVTFRDLTLRKVVMDELESLPGIYIASSAPWNIEITAGDATKEKMIEKVGRLYGISNEEIAVFGDGENDKPMLRHFRHSFAMGNAPDDVKRCAGTVIGSNDEDGVAEVMCR